MSIVKKILLICAVSLVGCNYNNGSLKNDLKDGSIRKEKSLSNKIASPAESANEDFDLFFDKFQTDSVYQKSHIKFPLKSIFQSDEGDTVTVIHKDNWQYVDFKHIEKVILKKEVSSANKVNILLSIEDTGIAVTYFFNQKRGLWYLASIVDQSD